MVAFAIKSFHTFDFPVNIESIGYAFSFSFSFSLSLSSFLLFFGIFHINAHIPTFYMNRYDCKFSAPVLYDFNQPLKIPKALYSGFGCESES